MLYIVNIVLALAAVWVLSMALVADWKAIRWQWKPALIAVLIEQCVLAYANFQARDQKVAVDTRLTLLFISLLLLVLSAALALFVTWHVRQRTTTDHAA